MRSHSKLAVVATTDTPATWGGKRWIKVTVLNGRAFYPSFEDLFRIVRGIVYCEREKYPNLRRDPADMVKAFLSRCVDLSDAEYAFAWETLRDEFQVPNRCAPRSPTPPENT